jgi:hypothetical protein
MENLIDTIKAAIAQGASDEARVAGAQACRTILVALDTPAGQPLAAPTEAATPTSQLQAVVTAMRGMPPEQLLDLAIARLKAALPPGTEAPQTQRLLVPLVPIAPMRGGRS